MLEKLLQAKAGSRELDVELFCSLYPGWTKEGDRGHARHPECGLGWVPEYTTSMDAAVLLMPGPYWTLRGEYNKQAHPGWIAETNDERSGLLSVHAQAASAALALCAVALKARGTKRGAPESKAKSTVENSA